MNQPALESLMPSPAQPMPRESSQGLAGALFLSLGVVYLAWQFVRPVFTTLLPGPLSEDPTTATQRPLHERNLFLEEIVPFVYGTFSTVLVYVIFASFAGRQRSLSIILGTLVVMAALNAAVGVWGAVTGESLFDATSLDVGVGTFGYDPGTGRSGGLRGENYVGVWCAPALAFGLLSIFARPLGPLGIVLTSLASASAVASFSRTSVVCAFIVFLTCVFFSIRRGLRVFRTLFVLVPLVAVVLVGKVVVQTQEGLFSDYARQDQERRWRMDSWEESRDEAWRTGLDAGLENPVLGHGPGSTSHILPLVPHNAFLDVLVEQGLVGLVIFSVPPCWLIWFFLKNSRTIANDRYLALLYAMFLGMIFAWVTLSSGWLRIIWIVAGLIHGRIARSSSARPVGV